MRVRYFGNQKKTTGLGSYGGFVRSILSIILQVSNRKSGGFQRRLTASNEHVKTAGFSRGNSSSNEKKKLFEESEKGMYYAPESQGETTPTRKARTRRMSIIEDPSEEKPIKIYPFSIKKLTDENATNWFYLMKRQLQFQNC